MTSTEERQVTPESTANLRNINAEMLQQALQWRGAVGAVQDALVQLKQFRDKDHCACGLRDFEAWLAEDLRQADSKMRCAGELDTDLDLLDNGMSLEQLGRMRQARRGA